MPETQRFDATSLKIDDFVGLLRIEPTAEPGVIEVVAEPDRLAKLQSEVRDGVLHVQDRERRRAGEWVDDLMGLARSFFGGRQETAGADPRDAQERVEIRIAPDMPVEIDDFVGRAVIGELTGPLRLTASAGSVDVAAAGPASLRIEGAGRLAARRIVGDLEVGVEGAGLVSVDDAQVGELKARVSGAGSVRVKGRAETADVTVSGAGAVRIQHVEQRPYTRLTGAGTIKVDNWP